jgi:Predicted membrane protein
MDFGQILRDTWQTVLVFLTLMILARILGKTQLGQLTFYEYISGITIGSIASNTLASEPDKLWSHYYDLILFCALAYLAARLTLVNRPLRKLIEGSPTVVVENGRILDHNMKGMRFDMDELMGQLREKGVLDLAEVQYAILETTGNLSIIPKATTKPVAQQDLNIQQAEPRLPVELIMDGEILADNLPRAKVSREWLINQLTTQGAADLKSVNYAALDSRGNLFISTDKRAD